MTAKGNGSKNVPETTRSLGFNAFVSGSDTVSEAKAVSGSVFDVPRVKMIVL